MTVKCRRLWGSVLPLILMLSGPIRASDAPPENPTAVVERLHQALLDVMKNADTLGFEGRRDKLTPVLTECFDLVFMVQKSAGRHWKTATDEEQAQLLATVTRFMIANYADRFDGYSGQQFETVGKKPSIHGTVIVESRLLDEGSEPAQLNYRVRAVGDHWKIIDIFLNGTVSEMAVRRSEYTALIQREGFQALLVALDDKIAGFESTPADQSW